MVEPLRAPVRPRVIVERATNFAPPNEPVLLEDLVAELAATGDHREVDVIELFGPPGSGTTTALQHLAFVLGTDAGLTFADQRKDTIENVASGRLCPKKGSDPSEGVVSPLKSGARRGSDPFFGQSPSGAILFSSPASAKPAPRAKTKAKLLKCRLAKWERDEWIEYLLATHQGQCGSVMRRLTNDPTIDSLSGNASLLRQIFDELAADENLSDVRSAVDRIIKRNFVDAKLRQEVMAQMLVMVSFEGNIGSNKKGKALLPELSAEQNRLIYVPWIRFFLAEESAWQELHQDVASDRMLRKWPRALIESVAHRVATAPAIQQKLQTWIDSKSRELHPLAVSLLHVSEIGWHWPDATPEKLQQGRVNLENAILDGADCTLMPLTNCRMSGGSFEGARLTGLDLQYTIAHFAQFDRADLQKTNLSDFEASNATFIGARLRGASGQFTNLSYSDLSFANMADARFKRSNFSNSLLVRADMRRVSFDSCDLTNCSWEKADFRQANFARSKMQSLDLTIADFRHASFHRAQMTGCFLEQMELPDTDFSNACLEEAVMTGSLMSRSSFSNASLRGAKLAEVNWESVDLRDADLSGAIFHMGSSRSGLVESEYPMLGSRTGFYTDDFNDQDFKAPEEIRKANLRGADLRGALIDGVDFYLVDLRDSLYDPDQEEQLRRTGAILATRAC